MEDGRGRKILSNLNSAFYRDPAIDEYDFLPVLEPVHNGNPMVLENHKLGMELWAAKLMFHSAYKRLFTWRTRKTHGLTLEPLEVACLTRAVLLFNADCATAWNIRKELIENFHLQLLDDLKLGALILTRFPKSAETFAHRKWVLEKMKEKIDASMTSNRRMNGMPENQSHSPELECASSHTYQQEKTNKSNINSDVSAKPGLPHFPVDFMSNSVPHSQGSQQNCPRCRSLGKPGGSSCMCRQVTLTREVKEIIVSEMDVAAMAAMHYPNNYNAWCHRIWVLQHIAHYHNEILLSELKDTRDWLWKHISDHSGFHYRQFLLSNLTHLPNYTPKDTVLQMVKAELEMTGDLISSYPGHEAVWYHRRFVLHLMVSSFSNKDIPASPNHQTKKSRLDTCSSTDSLVETENEFSNEMVKTAKDEWQKTLANKHQLWLKNVLSHQINALIK